ncbi:unnamed protein product [Penicillium camemberti]|uniref:Str. FM013 n=1 Tax=Penicillium camemberti (strain FM 013) TaxID=1429867 RepID=A0A0G4P786_PENC3|nr:unnamed protein product [Penicillium camemberti]
MYPTRMLRMQPTRAFAFPTPKEQQSAHTISQRLRQLKRVPPELLPIGMFYMLPLAPLSTLAARS